MLSDKHYLAYLVASDNFELTDLFQLLSYFGSWKEAFGSDAKNLFSACPSLKHIDKFITWRQRFNQEKFNRLLLHDNINLCSVEEDDYPALLRQVPYPPILLFYRGDLSIAAKPGLGVVGSRKITRYGEQAVKMLIPDLAQAGLIINSGLALGIDGLAHRSCLEFNGKTIAVLGTGVDYGTVYPSSHRQLAERIISSGGLLLSEFPPLTPGFKQNFPRRNRIISGLSLGVLVVEAAKRSGSLITTRFALEQNREVMAVPGPINNFNSSGTNDLIKKGAKVITNSLDILEALKMEKLELADPLEQLSEIEKEIYQLLKNGPVSLEGLKHLLNYEIRVITPALTMLELSGHIAQLPGALYGLLKNKV